MGLKLVTETSENLHILTRLPARGNLMEKQHVHSKHREPLTQRQRHKLDALQPAMTA